MQLRFVPLCLKSKCTDFLFKCLLDSPEITSYLLQSVTLGKLHNGVTLTPHCLLVLWSRKSRAIPLLPRFSTPVQTGPGPHPASCTMCTGSFLGMKSGRGVALTPHHLLVLWSRKSRAIPLLPLWAVRTVQSLSACTRVHFTYTLQVKYFLMIMSTFIYTIYEH